MMKQLSTVLFALGMSVGCNATFNGKPLFGGGNPPSATPARTASQGQPTAPASSAAPATTAHAGQPASHEVSRAPSPDTQPKNETAPAAAADANNKTKIEDVAAPDKAAPLTSWTAVQQWMPSSGHSDRRSQYGYGNLTGAVTLADELGDKLSQLGRASLVQKCLWDAKAEAQSALLWAVCGSDVRAIDLKKAEAELVAGGIGPESRAAVLATVKETIERAQKVGAAVEAAAKDDPGVAAVVKLGETARSEWATYASKHQDMIERYLALKDGVRSGKSNNKAFAGCYEATQPPFAKVVKATKFPWDAEGDYLPFYVSLVVTSTEGYLATVAHAACAWSIDESGESFYAAAANQKGGTIRAGARSLTVAKALDEKFEPKFAERSLSLDSMRYPFKDGIQMPGVNWVTAIMTPQDGKVSKVTKNGDSATISFAGDSVDACLQWKTTNRVSGVAAGGQVMYEKECVKRGKVANQEDDVKTSSKFVGGISPGVSVHAVKGFPVCAWSPSAYTAVLGVALK